jgi:hypothetical protein
LSDGTVGGPDVALDPGQELVSAEPLYRTAPPVPEYESIGWQYKHHSSWGGFVWDSSSESRNGYAPVDSREIFVKRSAPTKEAKRLPPVTGLWAHCNDPVMHPAGCVCGKPTAPGEGSVP